MPEVLFLEQKSTSFPLCLFWKQMLQKIPNQDDELIPIAIAIIIAIEDASCPVADQKVVWV